MTKPAQVTLIGLAIALVVVITPLPTWRALLALLLVGSICTLWYFAGVRDGASSRHAEDSQPTPPSRLG